MSAYAFEIKWNGGEKVSWTYLPTDDRARDFPRILLRGFKSDGLYRGPSRMTVKNSDGTTISTIVF
jgi:hypothetical protein